MGSRAFAIRYSCVAAATVAAFALTLVTATSVAGEARLQFATGGVTTTAAIPSMHRNTAGGRVDAAPGRMLVVRVGGFAPRVRVQASIVDTTTALTAVSNSAGVALIDMRIPAGLTPGAHRVAVYGPAPLHGIGGNQGASADSNVVVAVPRLVIVAFWVAA